MAENKLFVEPSVSISGKCVISPAVASKIGVNNGDVVKLMDPDNNATFSNCNVEISDDVFDFSIRVAQDVLDKMNFFGIEVIIEKAQGAVPTASTSISSPPTPQMPPQPGQISGMLSPPTPQMPPQPGQISGMPSPPIPQMPPQPGQISGMLSSPTPQMPPQPGQISGMPSPPTPQMPPQPGQISGMPSPPTPQMPPQPGQISSLSAMPPKPPSMGQTNYSGTQIPSQPSMYSSTMNQPIQNQYAQPEIAQPAPEPYPNKIDPSTLASQKPGSIVLKVSKIPFAEGKVKLNPNVINKLGLAEGMILGWECPLTRSKGSARIKADSTVSEQEIKIGVDTLEDTNTRSDQIVVYSTEPPIVHQDVLTLEVVSKTDLNGFLELSPRNAATLQLKIGDVVAFEDNLIGAVGAAKLKINETLSNNQVVIDSNLLEASGIGSMEVEIKKNLREIIPLQSVELGIEPIKGEDVWSVISMARQNIGSIKSWLLNFIIFKGIKLRWESANVSCEVLNTVPELTGDIFAQINQNTTITLKPIGLVTFNAILLIDISRSMMARDVEVKNIGPAIEGIKAAMKTKEINEFLKKFKPGVMVPRRLSAAFGAILFLSEKVGRGFGEKVAIVRFADEAQTLIFKDGKPYMDSSSGEKDVLEDAARLIVNQIANSYGQATNMGLAMLKAQELLFEFGSEMPTMIVLLTDGVPTDGNQFFEAIQQISKNPNIVLYIIGLGNPDDKAMKRAAALCGGEYFKPKDSGELLIWYSKRARDLQVKLKVHRFS
ncbi:MAG: vWA domain-containing protein [Promethearchaeota archaeon]